MASTYKTANYNLNEWTQDDKPAMADFNRDNKIVDEELGRIDGELKAKIDKASPIVHELELTNGFEKDGSAHYVKTQEGMVTVTFKVNSLNAIAKGTAATIGILPANFHPPIPINFAVSYMVLNRAWIDLNGNIVVRTLEPIPEGGGFMGTVTFFTQM